MLKILNLYKVFNKNTINENVLFDGLNFTINDGDFITVIGSNGAGKSTLLNIISGSIEEDEGSVRLNEKELSGTPEYKRSRHIGRVFQDTSKGVALDMTILENLSMAYNKGKSFNLRLGISKKNLDIFKKLLTELNLGLENKLDTKVKLLSGGQRQALCLVMAVMGRPELLLLDEHTAALDPKTSEKIIEITKKIVSENNMTTMMVTHNLNHAVTLGNRLIMMHGGNIVLDIAEEEKKKLTVNKLLEQFDRVQGRDCLSDRILFS
ncbi:ATP-binding cassette domain-containing protein [Clostridium swellfunianum]|uniref:ABC transporter ATP-binding protein n=1 Tax=Clostridium swellfunianum TaxID=1367462 RepID=UPI00202E29B5|nr:ATP-binding cassette domain-containing protein [Clostridium swellfunianum]MCM0646886.1 ATP-binding cassette domain-containing protein [Clostridium swellfunianum]